METKGKHLFNDPTYGLTKEEYMAIKFTKALLMNDGYNNVPMATLTKTAIDISKTLIKQLNEDGNTISKT